MFMERQRDKQAAGSEGKQHQDEEAEAFNRTEAAGQLTNTHRGLN